MNKSQFTDLYNGNAYDIWIDHEDEIITINIHGRLTVNLDKEEFQELYNAVFIAKQVLKEDEKLK